MAKKINIKQQTTSGGKTYYFAVKGKTTPSSISVSKSFKKKLEQKTQDRQIPKTKKWTILVTLTPEGKMDMTRSNTGFSALELLGVCSQITASIHKQLGNSVNEILYTPKTKTKK